MKLSTGGLARRQFGAHRSVSITVALIVVVVAGVLAAWPRAVAEMSSAQVTHEMAGTTPVQRDLVQVANEPPVPGPAVPAGSTDLAPATEETWGAFVQGLATLRAERPEPLRGAMADARLRVEGPERAAPLVEGNDVRHPSGSITLDPYLQDYVELVDGAWPAPVEPQQVDLHDDFGVTVHPQVVEVVVSAAAAERLGWDLGFTIDLGQERTARVSGTFEAIDPSDPYWQHNPYSIAPAVVDDPNAGVSAHTALYADPGTYLVHGGEFELTTRVWYALAGDAVRSEQVEDLLGQLRGFTAGPHTVVTDPEPGWAGLTSVQLSSEVVGVLEQMLAQQGATNAILAIVAAGPLGVTAAVLALGARLTVTRRRQSLALLGARGASGTQLRALMGVEGLLLGLPAAAIGAAVGIRLTPGPVATGDLLGPLLAGLAPAVMMALATSPRGLREQRHDLGARTGGRWRGIVEIAVHVVTVVAVLLLLQRGVVAGAATGAGSGAAVDPLLAATPLLLAVSTCLVVLRVYPLPVRALESVFRRRRGAVPFLGAARAVRDPAGGLTPALALVVGVSVAAFSTVMYSTVRGGVEHEAWSTAGADVRVTGPIVDDETAVALAAVDGVEDVALVADLGQYQVSHSVSGTRVTVFALDVEALGRVQAGAPGAVDVVPELTVPVGDAIPVAVSSALGIPLGTPDLRLSGPSGGPAAVVGVQDDVLGVRTPRDVAFIDRGLAAEVLGLTAHPRLALLSVADGADPAAVADAVREIVPNGAVTSPSEVEAEILGSPVSTGLERMFLVAIVLAVVLCGVAVAMTQMIGAPGRVKFLAVLRTLGFTRRQAQRLVAWELAPWAVVALVVGAGLGVAVPALVLATVDLTVFTAGSAPPPLAVDPLLLAAVAGGFVLVVVAAVAISTALSRRSDLATELRIGEER